LQALLNDHILILTETHWKSEKISIDKTISKIETRRKYDDKKGGGLMILAKKSLADIDQIHNECSEICISKVKLKNLNIIIIVVYFDVLSYANNIIIKDNLMKLITMYRNKNILIFGDFNARFEEIDGILNKNAEILDDIVANTDLSIINLLPLCNGKYTRSQNGINTTIDYVLANESFLPYINNMTIDEEKYYDVSDHNFIFIDINQPFVGSAYNNNECFFCTSNVKRNELFINYLKTLKNSNEELNLHNSAEKYLSDKKKIEENHNQRWISKSLVAKIEERRRINRARRKEKDPDRLRQLKERYIEQKDMIKKEVQNEKHMFEVKEVSFVFENVNVNKWKVINKMRKDPKSNTLNYNQTFKQAILEFWEKLSFDTHYNCLSSMKIVEHKYIYHDHILSEHNYSKRIGIYNIEPKISKSEVIEHIRRLKSKKAKDLLGLSAEIIKIAGNSETLVDRLCVFFNKILENNSIPESWKRSKLVLLPKKTKDLTEKDFRPITITNITYKLMSSIMRSKIEIFCKDNKIFEEEQCGFMVKRRIEENILMLQLDAERAKRRKQTRFYAFLDLEKAFDSVNRTELLCLLTKKGLNKLIIDFIKNVYEEETCHVYLNKEEIGTIRKNRGIKQGCLMSPILFNLVINEIIISINNMWPTAEDDFNILAYADDCLLKGDSIGNIGAKIEEFNRVSEKFGLRINTKKSKIICMNKKTDMLSIKSIDVATEEKYLGFSLDFRKTNFLKVHMKNKLSNIRKFEHMIYCLTAGKINKLLYAKTIWQSLAIPTMIYGCPVIDLCKGDIKTLNAAQQRIFKRVLNLPKHTPNSFILEECRLKSFEYINVKNKLLFLKHCLENTIKLSSIIQKEWRHSKILQTYKNYINELNFSHDLTDVQFKAEQINNYFKTLHINSISENSSLITYSKYHNFHKKPTLWKNTLEDKIITFFQSGVINHIHIHCGKCNTEVKMEHIYVCDENPYKNEIRNVHIKDLLMFETKERAYSKVIVWFYKHFFCKRK